MLIGGGIITGILCSVIGNVGPGDLLDLLRMVIPYWFPMLLGLSALIMGIVLILGRHERRRWWD